MTRTTTLRFGQLMLVIAFAALSFESSAQGVAIGTTAFSPVSSAMMEMRSSTQGLLMPRMTDAQKTAIVAPATGLLVYQTDGADGFYYYDGAAWLPFGGGGTDDLGNHTATQELIMGGFPVVHTAGHDGLMIDVAGFVGIGTTTPSTNLKVEAGAAGLNLPIFVQNRDNTLANSVGIGFTNEVASDFAKAAIVHQRGAAGMGVGDLKFLVRSAADNAAADINDTRMTITSVGNVGINDVAPGEKLEVTGGNIRLGALGGTAYGVVFQNPAATFTTLLKAGAQTADLTYTWPITAPVDGQMLQTDGDGNLSWSNGNGWALRGNAATNPALNYVGTTDAQPLRFATSGSERMRINATAAEVGIGMTPAANNSLDITNTTNTGRGLNITANSLNTGTGISVVTNSLTTGNALSVASSSGTLVGTMVNFSNTGSASGTVLSVTGSALNTGRALDVTANTMTTGTGVNVTTNGLTTGSGIAVSSTSALLSGSLANFTASGALTGTVLSVTGNALTSGRGIDVTANSMNTGSAIRTTTNGLTTGSGLTIGSTSTAFSSTNGLANFTMSGNNAANTGNILKVVNSGALNSGSSLIVTNNSAGLSLRLNDDGTDADATPVVVDATGQMAIGAAAPNSSAILDVVASNKGVRMPNVALTNTTDAATITSPATSLMVYNTATAGVAPNNVTPGYYYNSGTAGAPVWERLATGTGSSWQLTGNSGTNPLSSGGTNYIGTTTAQDLNLATTGVQRVFLSRDGGVTGNTLGVTSVATANTGLDVAANSLTTGKGVAVTANALTSGNGIEVTSTSAGLTGNLANFNASGSTSGTVLNAQGNALTTGKVANLTGNALTSGNGLNVSSTSNALSGSLANFDATASTSGTVVNAQGNALTTGKVGNFTGNALTTGNAVNMSSTSNALTGSLVNMDATASTTGTVLNAQGNELTTGKVANLTGNALTTGNGLNVTSTSAAMSGNLVNLDATATTIGTVLNAQANALTTGRLANISGNALTSGTGLHVASTSVGLTGNLVNLDASGSTTGTVLNAQGNSLTTGKVINVNANALTTGSGIMVTTTSPALTGVLADFNASAATDGSVLRARGASMTIGTVAQITGSSLTSGTGLSVVSSSAALTGHLTSIDATLSTTGTVLRARGNSLTTGTGLSVISSSSAFTGGTPSVSTVASTGLADISLTGSNAANTGNVLRVNNAGVANTGSTLSVFNQATSPARPVLDVKSNQTSGTILGLGSQAATALAGSLVGIQADLSTNYTNAAQSMTGLSVAFPATTAAAGSTITGLNVTSGAVTNASGSTNWRGLNVTMPAMTETAGTLNSTGIKVTGVVAGTGTEMGIEVADANVLISNSNGVSGQLQIQGNCSGTTTIEAGAQGGADIHYILPARQATAVNQALLNNGSGVLSWGSPPPVSSQAASIAGADIIGFHSTAYTPIASMSLTPGEGNFLLWFSTAVYNDNVTDNIVKLAVFVNGVIHSPSEREFKSPSDHSTVMSTNAYITNVLAGQVVDIRWKVSAAANNANMYNRSMQMMKVQ